MKISYLLLGDSGGEAESLDAAADADAEEDNKYSIKAVNDL